MVQLLLLLLLVLLSWQVVVKSSGVHVGTDGVDVRLVCLITALLLVFAPERYTIGNPKH